MISAVCSNHTGEATLPLRWLCQLPLCGLAAGKRLQAIIPRQQVYLLRKWEKQYAPQRTDEVWHPLFVEALEKKSYIEYLLDILLYDTPEEKKALVAEQRKEVMKLEQRIAGHTAEHDRGRSQRKSGLDR